ncbi:MAG: hypothetical protein KAS95_05805, partial [Candidatus Heimdallarchaeota archaeon]|nr:hypothetical protein [Candidatus Heimdallarchaeota archaeon]
DAGNDIMEFIVNILKMVFYYIGKFGIFFSITIISEKVCRTILYKNQRNLRKIGKGVAILLISLTIFIIVT